MELSTDSNEDLSLQQVLEATENEHRDQGDTDGTPHEGNQWAGQSPCSEQNHQTKHRP
jgi:hypothetical protein